MVVTRSVPLTIILISSLLDLDLQSPFHFGSTHGRSRSRHTTLNSMLAPPKPVRGGHHLRKRLSSRSRSRSRSPSTDVGSLLSDDEASDPETPRNPCYDAPSSSELTTAAQKPQTPHLTAKVPPAPQREQDEAVTTPRSWRVRIQDFWDRNYGLMLVLIAQFFATMMNVTTGLLEDDGVGGGMHPFQILFARMSITVLISLAYMWWSGTPDWPLGAKGIRWLLVFRGVGGFWGVFGLYCTFYILSLHPTCTNLSIPRPAVLIVALQSKGDRPFVLESLDCATEEGSSGQHHPSDVPLQAFTL